MARDEVLPMTWKQGQAVVRVIGGAVMERGEIERVDADGWACAFGVRWSPTGYRNIRRPGGGELRDAAKWEAAEAQRKASTATRIRQTAERAELRRRLDAALVALPTVRLEALVNELEAETRGGAA